MNDGQMASDRQRRLAELARIAASQAERNSDLSERSAEALIQQYFAEDRQASGNAAHQRGLEPSANHAPEDSSPEVS